MKKRITKVVLAVCLAGTLFVSDVATAEAACEIAQCNYIVRQDKRFGDIKCAKIFYAYWSGIDFFGAKSSAAQLNAQGQLAQHKLDCLHL